MTARPAASKESVSHLSKDEDREMHVGKKGDGI
jgi:hypothetical protein